MHKVELQQKLTDVMFGNVSNNSGPICDLGSLFIFACYEAISAGGHIIMLHSVWLSVCVSISM